MTIEEIEQLIVELLAENAKLDPTFLWEELCRQGDHMPVDSLLAAEVLARVQTRAGVQLPATAETATALRSVKSFAAAVLALIPVESGQAESA